MKRVRQARRILHLYSSSTTRDFQACYTEIKQQDILTSSIKLCSIELLNFKVTLCLTTLKVLTKVLTTLSPHSRETEKINR